MNKSELSKNFVLVQMSDGDWYVVKSNISDLLDSNQMHFVDVLHLNSLPHNKWEFDANHDSKFVQHVADYLCRNWDSDNAIIRASKLFQSRIINPSAVCFVMSFSDWVNN